MNFTNQKFFTIYFTIALALIQLLPDCVGAETHKKLRIGFIASLSGDLQAYGDAARNGFELALDELGRDWVEVLYEDDRFEPTKTVSAFKKLTEIDRVDAVITVGSNPSSAVAPLANAGKIPLFAWASDSRISKGNPAVLRTYPSGKTEGEVLVAYTLRHGVEKIGIVISNNAYAQSWKSGIVSGFGANRIVFDEEVTSTGDDFRSLIVRAQRRGAKAYAICLDVGKTAVFAKQLRELGATGTIIGCEYLHSRQEVLASNGALVGAWFSTATVTDNFREKVQKKYGLEGVISAAANHYDLAYLLYEAWKSGQHSNPIQFMNTQGSRHGAVGDFKVAIKDGEAFFDLPLYIQEVTADGYRSIG